VRDQLSVPVAIHIGASFDFVAGTIKRAPKWMSRIGLEWFYRLCREPKRMFRRYLIDDMKIFGMYFRYKRGVKSSK
jgi:exopolysaccharide biosynthesis WecB/TagA/CpsF family protein